jgi:hypothetical protein
LGRGLFARHAIAERQRLQRPVIRWVTKILLSRALPCFRRHVKPLVPAAFTVVSTHQSALGLSSSSSSVHYSPLQASPISRRLARSSATRIQHEVHVVDYCPLSLRVIYKEGLYPSSGNINMLMVIIIIISYETLGRNGDVLFFGFIPDTTRP